LTPWISTGTTSAILHRNLHLFSVWEHPVRPNFLFAQGAPSGYPLIVLAAESETARDNNRLFPRLWAIRFYPYAGRGDKIHSGKINKSIVGRAF